MQGIYFALPTDGGSVSKLLAGFEWLQKYTNDKTRIINTVIYLVVVWGVLVVKGPEQCEHRSQCG